METNENINECGFKDSLAGEQVVKTVDISQWGATEE
tara:strand:- start:309 stop:416 length:108 start_codon:yes stop_codon:yes gene_type:complete